VNRRPTFNVTCQPSPKSLQWDLRYVQSGHDNDLLWIKQIELLRPLTLFDSQPWHFLSSPFAHFYSATNTTVRMKGWPLQGLLYVLTTPTSVCEAFRSLRFSVYIKNFHERVPIKKPRSGWTSWTPILQEPVLWAKFQSFSWKEEDPASGNMSRAVYVKWSPEDWPPNLYNLDLKMVL